MIFRSIRGISSDLGARGGSARRPNAWRRRLEMDRLERRWVPASGKALTAGVDSLAIGDVNGDRIADIAVAGRQGGNFVVDIYDSRGQANKTSSTGWTVNLLAQLVNPLGKGVGPLSVALGDFSGTGVSELAVASSAPRCADRPVVAVYQFQLPSGTQPLGSPVTAVPLAKPFTPSGLAGAAGLRLAAADINGNGVDSLIVAPAQGGSSTLDILGYQPSSGTWQLQNHIGLGPLNMTQGVFLSAGDLQGNGGTEIAVGARLYPRSGGPPQPGDRKRPAKLSTAWPEERRRSGGDRPGCQPARGTRRLLQYGRQERGNGGDHPCPDGYASDDRAAPVAGCGWARAGRRRIRLPAEHASEPDQLPAHE